MRRYIACLIAVASLSAALTGCSTEGEVTVVNDGSTTLAVNLHNERFRIPSGASETRTIYIGKTSLLIGPTEREIGIAGGSWTKKFFTQHITVKDGENLTLSYGDDLGACMFTNFHSLWVPAVQVKRCQEATYGNTLLPDDEILSPSEEFLIQLDEGCWTLQVTYGNTSELDTVSLDMEIGKVIYLEWQPD
jgi:hypothetical protein